MHAYLVVITHSFVPVHMCVLCVCTGYWKVTTVCEGVQREYSAVMLFICDGSTSYLGKIDNDDDDGDDDDG